MKTLGSQFYCFPILGLRRLMVPGLKSLLLRCQPTQPQPRVLSQLRPKQPDSNGYYPS